MRRLRAPFLARFTHPAVRNLSRASEHDVTGTVANTRSTFGRINNQLHDGSEPRLSVFD